MRPGWPMPVASLRPCLGDEKRVMNGVVVQARCPETAAMQVGHRRHAVKARDDTGPCLHERR
jgi:hypothetical protein